MIEINQYFLNSTRRGYTKVLQSNFFTTDSSNSYALYLSKLEENELFDENIDSYDEEMDNLNDGITHSDFVDSLEDDMTEDLLDSADTNDSDEESIIISPALDEDELDDYDALED